MAPSSAFRERERSRRFAAGFVLAILFIPAAFRAKEARGVGTFLTNEYLQVAPVASQAAIFFDDGDETMIVGDTFMFNPLLVFNFSWLIPVPSEPTVELLKGEAFPAIEKLLDAPRRASTRPVDMDEYQVFSPEEYDGAIAWVSERGSKIPKSLRPMLEEYQQRGWYLVAVTVSGTHIQADARDAFTVMSAHTLPIKIRFRSDAMVVPFKFASARPDIDSEAIPLPIPYGMRSEDILGRNDEGIDALFSEPSQNKYPRLPLDLMTLPMELYVFAKSEARADGFSVVTVKSIDGRKIGGKSWNSFYLPIPKEKVTLTKLLGYRPIAQLDDVTVELTEPRRNLGASLFSVKGSGSKIVTIFAVIAAALFEFTVFALPRLLRTLKRRGIH